MTGKIEEGVRVQLEHKKLLVDKLKKTGGDSTEIEKLDADIAQLMDLLRQYEDKENQVGLPTELPKKEK